MTAPDLAARLAAAQDAEADLALLRRALAIESVTGNETGFAHFLRDEMNDLGLTTGGDTFAPGRENCWGTVSGAPDKPHLMFIGHTDTVHVRGWGEHWQGDRRENPFGGPEIDGEIWGRGASDLKGGICAALAAFRLLQTTGLAPEGGLSFAFVGDEESGEPGTGVSAGARDLVARVAAGALPKPDFAIYVEPTTLDVYTAQIGFIIAEITVTGKSAYFGTPELGTDALRATHELLSRLWAHEAELRAGPAHDLVGSASLLVTEIAGGGYIAVPGECRLSLIRKLRPGEALDDAVAALEHAIHREVADGITISVDYPAGRDHPKGGSPVEIAPDTPAALLLQETIRKVRPAAGAIGGAPYWSETPFLINGMGCPAVYCAPGDIAVAHTFEERIAVDEYLDAIRAFALFIAAYAGLRPA